MGKSTGFRYAGKGPGLQKKSKLARKYLPKSSNKVKGGKMDALDWGVESVKIPKHMVATGLSATRESGNLPVDSVTVVEDPCDSSAAATDGKHGVTAPAHTQPGDSPAYVPREPRTLADKYGLHALLAKVGDSEVEKNARQTAQEKTAAKKQKKCAPV